MGRPKLKLTKPELKLLRKLAEDRNQRLVAKGLGISYGALRRIIESDPAAAEALAEGLAVEEQKLRSTLVREATKEKNPNIVAAIFLLKARHGYRDKGDGEEVGNKVEIVFKLPGALSEKEYRKVIAATPPTALKEAGVIDVEEVG